MMTCNVFLDGFSDYLDGQLCVDRSEAFDLHLEGCVDCSRYRDVMLRSLELVRALDPPTPSAAFNDRLNARLYVEEEMSLATGPLGSGATSGTTVVITLLFAAAAWSPTMSETSFGGQASPVTVAASAGTQSPPTVESAGLGAFSAGQITLYEAAELEEDLWSHPNAVFYAYSPLSRRRNVRPGSAAVRAVGLQ